MDEFDRAVVEDAIRSRIGKRAIFSEYDRTLKTPMNFLLDSARDQLGVEFVLYWADTGTPEVFCLRGNSETSILFSQRYLELTAYIRQLLTQAAFADMRIELAARACLKVIAELALRNNMPDFAVLCFIKSMVGKGIYFLDDRMTLYALERAPIDEAYMATWFYGIAHELGHIGIMPSLLVQPGRAFDDAAILGLLEASLNRLPMPAAIKEKAFLHAKVRRDDFVLGLDLLRRELMADVIGMNVLLRATPDIMRVAKTGPFRIEKFVAEMVIYLNIIILLERCSRLASVASSASQTRSAALDMMLQPAAGFVRAIGARALLTELVFRFDLREDVAFEERLGLADRVVGDMIEHFSRPVEQIDSGLAQAMRFVFFPDEREPDLEARFTRELADRGAHAARQETSLFVSLADQLDVHGSRLDALKAVLPGAETRRE